MPNKITNKTMKTITSWLDLQSIPEEVAVMLVYDKDNVKMLQVDTTTNEGREYVFKDKSN